MPMLVITGSASTQATSPGASAASRAAISLNSTTLVWAVKIAGFADKSVHHFDFAMVSGDEGVVNAAMIAMIEDQDFCAPRDGAAPADDSAVCVGCCGRDLPDG